MFHVSTYILVFCAVFQFLYKMLMDREEHPLCCREYHIKCWRHCLYSVKIKSRCDAEDEEDDEEVGEDREEEEDEDDDDDEDENEDEDEDDDEDEDEEEEGAEDQGEGAGDGDGDGEEYEQDDDDDGLDDGSDDAELLKTLSGLEKDYVFELHWSTLDEDGELDSLQIGFQHTVNNIN